MRLAGNWNSKCFFLLFLLVISEAEEVRGQSPKSPEQDVLEPDSAFAMFSILLANDHISLVSDQQTNGHVVFKDGVVYDRWSEYPSSSPDNSTDASDLHHDDQYSDRISFDFSYGKFHAYDISTPTATSSQPSVSKPKIIDFQNEKDEQSGSFTVVYDCERSVNNYMLRDVTISVVVPVVSGLSVLFQFRKTCGGGFHKYIELGYYHESENDAKARSRAPFRASREPIVVGPLVMNTRLYIHLSPPARIQEFFRVSVKSTDPMLEITPKGPVFGGVLTRAEYSIIHVLYECNGPGRYEVHATVPINPFNALNASWIKDCGGGLARGFNIGSEVSVPDDIVKMGETLQNWGLGIKSSGQTVGGNASVMNESVRTKEFWLSNDGFPLYVAPAIVAVENPSVLTVVTPEGYKRRSIYAAESNGLIPTGEKVRCRLRMICKRKGKSVVVVTFPIKSFTNVEVAFLKRCRAPRQFEHSGFLKTANSVMMAISIFMTFLLAYCGRRQWQAAGKVLNDKLAAGFQPVEAHQRVKQTTAFCS